MVAVGGLLPDDGRIAYQVWSPSHAQAQSRTVPAKPSHKHEAIRLSPCCLAFSLPPEGLRGRRLAPLSEAARCGQPDVLTYIQAIKPLQSLVQPSSY